MSFVKETMIKTIKNQPDDSSFEEILQELSFTAMVNRGIKDSKEGRTTDINELKEEIKK